MKTMCSFIPKAVADYFCFVAVFLPDCDTHLALLLSMLSLGLIMKNQSHVPCPSSTMSQ